MPSHAHNLISDAPAPDAQDKLEMLSRGNFNPNRGEPAVEACLQAASLGGPPQDPKGGRAWGLGVPLGEPRMVGANLKVLPGFGARRRLRVGMNRTIVG